LNDTLYSSKPNDCKSVEEWLLVINWCTKSVGEYSSSWWESRIVTFYVLVFLTVLMNRSILFSAASYVHPPLHVIQAIFRAARVIWKYSINQPNIPIWSIPATDNSTPLFVACSTGATTDVLQCYLDEVDRLQCQIAGIETKWSRN
jgi:hypothetical protein